MLRIICLVAILGVFVSNAEARLFGGGMRCNMGGQQQAICTSGACLTAVDTGPPQAKASDIVQTPATTLSKPISPKAVATILDKPATLSGVDLKGLAALNTAPTVMPLSNVASK